MFPTPLKKWMRENKTSNIVYQDQRAGTSTNCLKCSNQCSVINNTMGNVFMFMQLFRFISTLPF